MSTHIDDLNPREVASSLAALRSSADGRSLIAYACGDERLALWLVLLGRVISFVNAEHTEYPVSVWRDFYERGYAPGDAGAEVYGLPVLRVL